VDWVQLPQQRVQGASSCEPWSSQKVWNFLTNSEILSHGADWLVSNTDCIEGHSSTHIRVHVFCLFPVDSASSYVKILLSEQVKLNSAPGRRIDGMTVKIHASLILTLMQMTSQLHDPVALSPGCPIRLYRTPNPEHPDHCLL
jgi:hypothetical protein